MPKYLIFKSINIQIALSTEESRPEPIHAFLADHR